MGWRDVGCCIEIELVDATIFDDSTGNFPNSLYDVYLSLVFQPRTIEN